MLRFMSLTLFCTMTSLVIAADLHIQGSNTIGANLGPALVGFFAAGEIARHHLYGYTGVLTVFTTAD